MKLSKMKPICGIYKITNTKSGRVYIGQSFNMMLRWAAHVDSLVSGRHINAGLQEDFRNCGLDSFEAEIIERCSRDILLRREEYYISRYHQQGHDLYNRILDVHRIVAKPESRLWTIGWKPAANAEAKPKWSGVPFDAFDEAGRGANALNEIDPDSNYFVVEWGEQ